MTRALERIPPLMRRIAYALPLFFLWIIGITWDKDDGCQKSAGQSMVTNFLYFLWLILLAFLDSLLGMLLNESVHGWTLYYLQIAGAVTYLLLLVMVVLEKGTFWIEALRVRLIALFE